MILLSIRASWIIYQQHIVIITFSKNMVMPSTTSINTRSRSRRVWMLFRNLNCNPYIYRDVGKKWIELNKRNVVKSHQAQWRFCQLSGLRPVGTTINSRSARMRLNTQFTAMNPEIGIVIINQSVSRRRYWRKSTAAPRFTTSSERRIV